MKIKCIGLTGVIGSGKSQVSSLFKALGAHIIDTDVIARQVVEPNSQGLTSIVQAFGSGILKSDNTLNRSKLADVIFSDQSKRKLLESILHPLIRSEFTKKYTDHRNAYPDSLIVAVIPLLYESDNKYPELEKVLVVASSNENCISRIMLRDNCSRELAEKKLNSQMSITEKIRKADYVIENNGTLADLELATKTFYNQHVL